MAYDTINDAVTMQPGAAGTLLVMDYVDGETLDDYLAEHCGMLAV